MSKALESETHMDAQTWAMVVGLSVLWGGSFFFVQVAVEDLPPFTIVFSRLFLAVLTLLLGLKLLGLRLPRSFQAWRVFFLLGFINNAIPFSLFVWAQTHITSGLASILNATTPLFSVLLSHFFIQGETLKAMRVLGVLVGLGGVSVMIGVDALESLGTQVLAQLACLGAAFAYAVSGILGKKAQSLAQPPLVISTGQLICGCALITPLMLVVDRPWTLAMPGLDTVGALLGLSVLSTAVAYFIYFKVMTRTSATNLLLVTFLLPISAILLGGLILGEKLTPNQWFGMAIIGLSLIIIDGRLFRRQ